MDPTPQARACAMGCLPHIPRPPDGGERARAPRLGTRHPQLASVIVAEFHEEAKTLKLWVRRKPVHRGFECSGCGRRLHQVHDVREREIRDLPWSVYRATVVVEVHRLRCPECGVRVEKIE